MAGENISSLYLPEQARQFKKKEKPKMKKTVTFENVDEKGEFPKADLPGKEEKSDEPTDDLDFQLLAIQDYAEALQTETRRQSVKFKKPKAKRKIFKAERRRASFSDKLMKYDDWMAMANP